VVDAASPGIIAGTAEKHTSFVRLYFRPTTPTQFVNEGIRPPERRPYNAHCPVPVFFCFDLYALLSRDGTLFSNGNMARHSKELEYGDSEDLFSRLVFEDIYHRAPLPSQQPRKDEIIFRRQAEVLVPDLLALDDSLKLIACRSQAELHTLVHLTGHASGAVTLLDRCAVGPVGFFSRVWTFVENVWASGDCVEIALHPAEDACPPLDLRFEYRGYGPPAPVQVWTGRWEDPNRPKPLRIRPPKPKTGEVRFYIAGCLAFGGRLSFENAPF
jgi:hypothetical protein